MIYDIKVLKTQKVTVLYKNNVKLTYFALNKLYLKLDLLMFTLEAYEI